MSVLNAMLELDAETLSDAEEADKDVDSTDDTDDAAGVGMAKDDCSKIAVTEAVEDVDWDKETAETDEATISCSSGAAGRRRSDDDERNPDVSKAICRSRK